MFLRRTGYSGRYAFDVIYSGIQKFMRRGMQNEALEMCKEFHDFPNALKKRLVYCICEDCPDLDLVYKVFNTTAKTAADIHQLVKFVPVICSHMKSRETFYHFYYLAATGKYSAEPLNVKDSEEAMLSKIVYHLAHGKQDEAIAFFEKHIYGIPLKRIYNFSGKNRCFFFVLVAYFHRPHLREKCVLQNVPFSFNIDKDFVMPQYVYDKHVKGGDKSYKFFLENMIMTPCEPFSETSEKAKKIYIETNANGSFWLDKIAKGEACLTSDE